MPESGPGPGRAAGEPSLDSRLAGRRNLPTIEASRLVLRGLGKRDIGAVFGIFSDPEVLRYWSHRPFTVEAQAASYVEETLEGFANRTFYQWGVARRGDDQVLGTCTLWQLDHDNRRSEIGFVLDRSHWGQGLMTEALEALFDFCFDEIALLRLEADVDPQNTASIALLEKLGFRREGHMRERWLVAGETFDSYFYGLLARDWRRGGAGSGR